MVAVERILEKTEANKIKQQQLSEARFHHQHTFTPVIKPLKKSPLKNYDLTHLMAQVNNQMNQSPSQASFRSIP